MSPQYNEYTGPIVQAPYNFVPFSPYIIQRYASSKIGTPDAPPAHDRMQKGLHSGEITIKVTAETPLFIGGETVGTKTFYKDARGIAAIPGSSFRGLIRENVQILGLGQVSAGDVYNRRIFYRTVGSAANSVAAPLKDLYRQALKIRSIPVGEKMVKGSLRKVMVSRAGAVCAGYLHRNGRQYSIVPVKGQYLHVKRAQAAEKFGTKNEQIYPCLYRELSGGAAEVFRTDEKIEGAKRGILVFAGRPIKATNSVYVFPEEDRSANPILLDEDSVSSYQDDYDVRQKQLVNKKFWDLPRNGESKPVFYLKQEDRVVFGMTQFLRMSHKYRLCSGIPSAHRLLKTPGEFAMDYAHTMFGYAGKKESYASRVFFDDLSCTAEHPAELPPIPMVLGEPKPSFYAGYTIDGKHYSEDGFTLRGYKKYWLKDFDPRKIPQSKENVQTTFRPLAKGTTFRGTIRFRNLHTDELGLLLWAIGLEESCRQSIGMGKPYGLGRIRVEIESLRELSRETMYSLEGFETPYTDTTEKANAYIREAKAKISEELRTVSGGAETDIMKTASIRDFFYLTTLHPEIPKDYMALYEYKNISHPLLTVSEFRSGMKQPEEIRQNAAPSYSGQNPNRNNTNRNWR